jgi:hypothetical protein
LTAAEVRYAMNEVYAGLERLFRTTGKVSAPVPKIRLAPSDPNSP